MRRSAYRSPSIKALEHFPVTTSAAFLENARGGAAMSFQPCKTVMAFPYKCLLLMKFGPALKRAWHQATLARRDEPPHNLLHRDRREHGLATRPRTTSCRAYSSLSQWQFATP
jgi:hypothetical protein